MGRAQVHAHERAVGDHRLPPDEKVDAPGGTARAPARRPGRRCRRCRLPARRRCRPALPPRDARGRAGRGSGPRPRWRARAPRWASGRRVAPSGAGRRKAPASAPAGGRPPRSRRRRRRRARPGRPASRRSRTGQNPDASRAFELGQWATPVPAAPTLATSEALRWTACAYHTSPSSHPSSSTTSSGRWPKRARQSRSSAIVSARWVCNRRPSRRASAADSLMSSVVTENGLHGATTTLTRSPSCSLAATDSVEARMASVRSTTSSGGKPPALWPRSIEPRDRWRRTPTLRPGRRDGVEDRVVAAGHEVVVVGHRRRPAQSASSARPTVAATPTSSTEIRAQTG